MGAYHRPESAPIIEELCCLLKNVNMEPLFANSAEADYPEEHYSHLLGNMSALHLLSVNDVNGLSNTLQECFTVEDNDLVQSDEVEMVLQRENCSSAFDENREESEEVAQDFNNNDMEIGHLSSDDENEIQPLRQSVLLDHFKPALNTEDEVDSMVREEGV